MIYRSLSRALLLLGVLLLTATASSGAGPARRPAGRATLAASLKRTPFRVAWECYVDGNWEIFVMNADGSRPVNLTKTPDVHEHYPQVSPDGSKILFSVDSGEGRDAIRSLWVMDANGRGRRKVADNAREPFWSPDSKTIGYLPQEYPRFNVIDYYTKGMEFYDLRTSKSRPHPNSAKLHHLYNPGFAPDGKWIVATVHAGMGFGHAILLIEAHGDRVIDLKIPGCRPRICPDDRHIAWGPDDHELAIAPIDLDSGNPVVGPRTLTITDAVNKIYHIGWSPDGRFVAFSRGPEGGGDLSKKGCFQAANEIVGVYAAHWNIFAVPADHKGTLDLVTAGESDVAQLTTNGDSNKQPVWFRPRRR